MQQHDREYLARRPPFPQYSVLTHPQPPVGVKMQKHFFSKRGHVTYQIKGNGAQSIVISRYICTITFNITVHIVQE